MYIAFLIVSPMDKGPSLSKYVKKAVESIKDSGIEYQITPMGTVLQSDDIQKIFDCSKTAIEAIRREGSDRISLSLKIDIRYDKDITFESKLKALE